MARYDIEDGAGFTPNHAVVPTPVNAPVIFLAPKQRTASSGELWLAASSPDANYGGCVVWLSNDTAHYYQIGVIDGRSHQGVLTAALPAAGGLDTVHTLSVDLSQSLSILESVSQQTCDRLDSLCYVGGELVSFRDAVATGLYSYDLSYLHRGVYGTATGAAINAPFVLLSGPMLRYRFNKNAVGGQLHFKFQGFNIYGGGVQDLADCVAYSVDVTVDGGIKALLSDLPMGLPAGGAANQVLAKINAADFAVHWVDASSAQSGTLIFLSTHTVIGPYPTLIGSTRLIAGTYPAPSAEVGCGDPAYAATLELRDASNALLATIGGVPGGVAWRTAAAGFTLAATTDINLILYTNAAGQPAFIHGFTLGA